MQKCPKSIIQENYQMLFILGSNQFLTHLLVVPCKTKYNFFFFLSAQEKNNQINLKARMSNMTRKSVSWGFCSNIMRTNKNCISLDVHHVQWHSFSSSEHCGFRSPVASASVRFWLLQVFFRVRDHVDQSLRVPFDAQLCRF